VRKQSHTGTLLGDCINQGGIGMLNVELPCSSDAWLFLGLAVNGFIDTTHDENC